MNYTGPFIYSLYLDGQEKERFIKQKIYNGVNSAFLNPVNLSKTPKIYILKHNDNIVYIGYASQSIGTRLSQGIRANGRNGYHGYKWKEVEQLDLLVFVFDKTLKGNKHKDDKSYIAFAEAVEAELVFKVRLETGNWPEFQNEIHFNNVALAQATAAALDIYKKATV